MNCGVALTLAITKVKNYDNDNRLNTYVPPGHWKTQFSSTAASNTSCMSLIFFATVITFSNKSWKIDSADNTASFKFVSKPAS